VKKLFLISCVACLAFVFALSAYARDSRIDYLVNQGLVTEEDVAAAETEGPNQWMAKSAHDIYISGYVQPRFTWVDDGDPESAFDLRRARIKVEGMLGDAWGFVLETELAGDVSLRTVGVWFDTGYGVVKVGQFRVPFAVEGITSSGKLDTINRAAIVGEVDNRDVGAFWGQSFLEDKVSVEAAVTNGTGTNAAENNDEKDYWVRVAAKPWQGSENAADGLTIAGAYNMGDQAAFDAEDVDLGDFERTRWAGTVEWAYDQVKVQGEYIKIEQDLAIGGSVETDGWYVLAAYEMPVDAMTVIPVVKYEELESDIIGEGGEWITLGVTFAFVGRSDVKLEVNYVMEDLEVGEDVDELILQLTANY